MLVLFSVGPLRLGVDVRRVREVARAIPISAPLPEAGGVVGMITLRGESTAVVDLGVVLGLHGDSSERQQRMIAVEHNGASVCLLVDRIEGLLTVDPKDLEEPPAAITDVDVRWLDYMTRSSDGALIGVLNLDRVLSRSCLKQERAETASV
jgi:purine-binding chemotaxis protein CheW